MAGDILLDTPIAKTTTAVRAISFIYSFKEGSKFADIVYETGYYNDEGAQTGWNIIDTKSARIVNAVDDPTTPGDESSTELTQLLVYLKNNIGTKNFAEMLNTAVIKSLHPGTVRA